MIDRIQKIIKDIYIPDLKESKKGCVENLMIVNELNLIVSELKQVKKPNTDDVSKCECGETKDLITVCEDCTYKMVSEGN